MDVSRGTIRPGKTIVWPYKLEKGKRYAVSVTGRFSCVVRGPALPVDYEIALALPDAHCFNCRVSSKLPPEDRGKIEFTRMLFDGHPAGEPLVKETQNRRYVFVHKATTDTLSITLEPPEGLSFDDIAESYNEATGRYDGGEAALAVEVSLLATNPQMAHIERKLEEEDRRQVLRPNEAFFSSERLEKGKRFAVAITGSFNGALVEEGVAGWSVGTQDACTVTAGAAGENPTRKSRLWFDDSLAPEPALNDTQRHRYVFVYEGTGDSIKIVLEPPEGTRWDDVWGNTMGDGQGCLTVGIDPLSASDETAWIERRMEKQAETTRDELEGRVEEVIRQYSFFAKFEEPEFLRKHAQKYLGELLTRREEIFENDRRFHEDREFIRELKKRSPESYRRACWEMHALAIAMELDLEEVEADKLPEKARETEEEHRERKARLATRKIKDMKAIEAELAAEGIEGEELEREMARHRRDWDEREERRRSGGGGVKL